MICEICNKQFKIISNDWFKENAHKIDYSLYCDKIKNGMKRWLK